LKRSVKSALLLFPLDRHCGVSLHQQIYGFLRRAMRSGALPPNSLLPSTRALANRLGVSRNTVLTVYDELAADGLVTSRTGSGTRVLGGASHPTISLPDWQTVLRNSHYPAKVLPIQDPDGNSLYLHR
jgi:GntR family transcriptional regulator/MocR family aminotransferase